MSDDIPIPTAPVATPTTAPTTTETVSDATPAPVDPNTKTVTDAPDLKGKTETTLSADNWQDLMAGDDEKVKKALSRYASPAEVAKALLHAKAKLSERVQLKKPADDASDEDKQAWREAWGVPEKPDGYEIKLSEGRTVSETDKPIVDSFLEKMHKANASPELVQSALDTYYEIQEKQNEFIETQNAQHKQKLEDDLRLEYGSNYRANINTAKTFIEKTFGNNAEIFEKAIGNDGVMLMNNPDIVRAFVNLGLADNPRATFPMGMQSVDNVANRMKEIEKNIANGSYYRDKAMQDEYTKLIEFSQKNK